MRELYYAIAAKIDSFKPRQSQLKMASLIDQVFKAKSKAQPDETAPNLVLIEAPTGTGKSLAYLLAGIKNAKQQGKKFVISTATKTLQNQLFYKDLPQLLQISEEKFSYALAKGRNNYMCPQQLEHSKINHELVFDPRDLRIREQIKQLDIFFQNKRWDGDLDSAPLSLEFGVKEQITIDSRQCLGYLCAYNQAGQCPLYTNREELKHRDVIISNHSLLIADLAAGGGVILPFKPEDYFLCLDEAHTFSNYATSGFMAQFELKESIANINNIAKFIGSPVNQSYLLKDVKYCEKLSNIAQELAISLERFYQLCQLNKAQINQEVLILAEYLNPLIDADFNRLFIEIAFTAGELLQGLEKAQEQLRDKLKASAADLATETNLSKLGFYLGMVDTIANTANYLINQDSSRYNANARWLEYKNSSAGDEYNIIAGVTHVGSLLEKKLWSRVYAAVLTSATLAVRNDFFYIKQQLGLNLIINAVVESKLDSEFNYLQHSQLVIPKFRFAPEYNNRNQFQQELKLYLAQVLDYSQVYGTLVLFFNRQQLLEVFRCLNAKLQQHILLQTEFSSNHKLIAQHKQNIDQNKPSIIFGLNSFAEGVDLPLIYCMHVIITKLPFETHKDPQNMVKEYWVKAENGNFFMEVSLPETTLKLIQAVGRLLRSDNDYGQITICDNRIVIKQYGAYLLEALPPFNRNYNSEFIQQSLVKMAGKNG